MKNETFLLIWLLAGIMIACTGESSDQFPSRGTELVKVRNDSKYGKVLTDTEGRTLYMSANDSFGIGTCTGTCLTIWPVFDKHVLKGEDISSELDVRNFRMTTRPDGEKQLCYKGRPLYYHTVQLNGRLVPEPAGHVSGDGKENVWFVAKPDYTITLSNAQLTGHDGVNYTSDYKTGIGKTMYLTDAFGQTLYTYSYDARNRNNFTVADFSNNYLWPIFEEERVVVPASLDKREFNGISVHGRRQMTYKGWALYYFSRDGNQMGSNQGVSFPMSGGIWPVPVRNIGRAPEIPFLEGNQ